MPKKKFNKNGRFRRVALANCKIIRQSVAKCCMIINGVGNSPESDFLKNFSIQNPKSKI